MTLRPTTRLSRVLLAAATGVALTATLVAPAAAHGGGGWGHGRGWNHGRLANQIDLPVGFQPEGIAVDDGPTAYLGSRTDGDVVAVDLRSGRLRVLAQGPGAGNPSIGLKVDRGRIYVAGGPTGTARVLSTSGRTVADVALTTSDTTFVNDVVLTRSSAWFTDSLQPQLYRVSRSGGDAPTVTTVPLSGDWVQTAGVNNANGIALTPDRRSLLVVQSNTGFLFTVNPTTGAATRVDLGSTLLTNGDGLLVRGRALFAVQNRLNQVAVVHLAKDGSSGRLVDTLTADDLAPGTSFDVPTTVAYYRGSLFLPNARFGNAAPLTADYWISRLPLWP